MGGKRKWWVAAILSLVCTGLGHVYCGRFRRGLTYFFVSLAVVPLACLAVLAGPSEGLLVALLIAAPAGLLIWIVAAVDSVLVAIRGSRPRAYSRLSVYVLYPVVGLLLSVGATLLVRHLALEAFVLPTHSMTPTVQAGDRILVNKLHYSFSDPKRWDVVVFRYPADRSVNYIKRIVGLPGDRVEIRDGRLILNGEEVPLRKEEEPGDEPPPEYDEIWVEGDAETAHRLCLKRGGGGGPGFLEATVPESSYFLLGDCRANSRDSRHFGFVPREDVIGPAWYLFLPGPRLDLGGARSWSRFGVLPGAGR